MRCRFSFIDIFDLRIIRFLCYPILGGSNIYFTWMLCDWFVKQPTIGIEQAGAFGAFTAATVAFAKYFLHEMNKEMNQHRERESKRRTDDSKSVDVP